MPHILFHHLDGSVTDVEVESGTTVMRAALKNNISEIVGECGGQLMCGSCHVYVRDVAGSLPNVSEEEDDMLECTSEERRTNSRLCCQLTAGDDFETISLDLPATQQ